MLTVDEALSLIVTETQPFAPERVPLGEAFGLALAEDVVSEVDSPPFDKSLMDGFAVRSDDVTAGATLTVIEEVTAGRVPTKPVRCGEATRVMTGAPIPDGADAVLPVERAEFDAERVHVTSARLTPGTNVLRRGAAMRRGERVFSAGQPLRPQGLALLAELGHSRPLVRRAPGVAVLATGDELVPIDQTPGPGQIRNSNETMLAGQIQQAGAIAVPLGIARDNRQHLWERIERGLEHDVLLLSGGVSAGKLDLVPEVLAACGVREVFHKVDVKPGKPVWFGVRSGSRDRNTCYVFGLPGNPVSSLVCFELFARTALRRLMGVEPAEPQSIRVPLSQDHLARSDRPTYHPARMDWTAAGQIVTPLPWQGSADLRATADANAMALIPAGEQKHAAGTLVEVFPWFEMT